VYPKNSASPPQVAIGPVVQISDGAVQTSGCTVRIIPIGVAEGDGGGSTAYSTDGIVLYTPTQAETNYTSFILIAKKAGCIPATVTVVTSASSTAGRTMPADGSITAAVIADAAIDNATLAADVGSTAYATNIIALAVRKVLDELNLDHLMKVAVANNADLTTEVVDATVLSHIMSAGDTSVFATTTDGLQPIRDKLPANLEDLNITDTTGLVRPDMANASGNYAGTVGKSPATLAAGDVSGNLPADIKAYSVQPTVTGATLDAAYDAAKTAARAGDKMDLLDTIMENA
jgi:hypothetical protein